jgi:hypothetical protein
MPKVEVLENPHRRKRGRRHLSAKQLAYGFGGKRYRTRHTTRRRRRNPTMAALAGNPRRRRHHRRHGGFSVRHVIRRRNPGMLGGITKFVDVKGALYVAGGILIARTGPKLIGKVWAGAPTTGIGLYVMQLASAVAGAMVVRYALKSEKGAEQVATGGIGYVLYQLANDYVLPQIGLSGIAAPPARFVSTTDLNRMAGTGSYVPRIGMSKYVPRSGGVSGMRGMRGQTVSPEMSI